MDHSNSGTSPTASPEEAALAAVRGDRERIFADLSRLVSFNSVHGQPELAQDAAGAASAVAQLFGELGLDISAHETTDGSTAIIARKEPTGGAPTVLLYCHHDVVAAGDHSLWESDPFELTERDGRWYGRGAADCKGNIAMHLAALRAVQAAGGTDLGLIVLAEGSEEQGGAGLDDLVASSPELTAADAILIADTGNAAVRTPTLTTALRGGAQVTVTVRTIRAAMHSGMFGGAAPDAGFALIKLLNTLRDADGRTVIEGVDTSATWPGEPYPAETFRKDAGILDGVRVLGTGAEHPSDLVWARPAITLTGWTTTPVDEAVNAVPATAQARLNLRVAAGSDPAEIAEKLAEHLKNHAPWGAHVDVEIADVNEGFACDTSRPAVQLLAQCLAEAYGARQCAQIGSGGSIPLTKVLQDAHPDAEIALFGVEEPQSAIHAPNESVDPTEIERIAAAEALFLLRFGR